MGIYRGEAGRPKHPIHFVPMFLQATACGTAWDSLPVLDMATTKTPEVTCQACKSVLAGSFRVVRTVTAASRPITLATGPISRELAMVRFSQMAGWGMDRVRVVREQDYRTGVYR
jgi:hypothetical protein